MTRKKNRILYRNHGITIKTTRMANGWKATADVRPPLKNGLRGFTILGAKTATLAATHVLQWAKAYMNKHM